MPFSHPLSALLWKEFTLDIRTKNGFWPLLLYTVGSIYIVYAAFMVKSVRVSPPTWNALFWILLVYNTFQSVSKSFFHESENRYLYYYFNFKPEWVILSKIIYNSALVWFLSLVAWLFYGAVLGNPVQNQVGFLAVTALGATGLASVMSLVSALAAKAGKSHVLLAVLGFPVLLPVLLYAIKLTSLCMDGFDLWGLYDKWFVLLCIDGLAIALGWILYPFVWKN